MRPRVFVLTFLQIVLSISFFATAQSKRSIIDELAKKDESGGFVLVNASPQINALVGNSVELQTDEENDSFVKMKGFRIQVYSGNQKHSKDEAFERAKEIRETFHGISTYVTYKAPVWRLRVGDFQTREEASAFIMEMKQKFPSQGKEMYVVSDEIKINLY